MFLNDSETVPPPPACTVAKLKLPEPSVCSTWFALPSDVGKEYAWLKVITPLSATTNRFVPSSVCKLIPVLSCAIKSVPFIAPVT